MTPALAYDLTRDDAAPALEQALAALRRDELVVLPTETVYGLAARPAAAAVLDAAKGARTGPYALAVPDREAAERLVGSLPGPAARAAERWWPGPMTLVVPAPDGERLGLRVPGHPFVRDLLRSLDEPLLLTSANTSGQPPPQTLDELEASIREAAAVLIDGGRCALGEASTVLACGPAGVRVLREGVVRREELGQRVRGRVLVVCSGNTCRSPMAAALLARCLGEAAAADARLLVPEVCSAGLMAGAGQPASQGAQQALHAAGLDLSDHASAPFDAQPLDGVDLLLGMTPGHVAQLSAVTAGTGMRVELFDPAGQPVEDPFGAPLAHYRRCATMLADMATRRAAALLPAP